MKKQLFVVLIPVFTLFFSFLVSSQEIKKDFHESFSVEKGVVLILKHGDGDVTVNRWDKDVVDITVRYRAEFKIFGIGSRRDFDVEFNQRGNTVYVTGKEKGKGGITIGIQTSRRYEYTYDIKAPGYTELDFRGDDGEVKVEDWYGNIICILDDGNITLRNIQSERMKLQSDDGAIRVDESECELDIKVDDGDIYLENCQTEECRISGDDGEISLRRCSGSFEIGTDDGDINFDRVQAEMLNIKSDAGDIDLRLLKTDRFDLDIYTDDGNVIIELERGISAMFSLDSDDGRIRVDIPDVKNYRERRHQKYGEIYGGKGRIRVRTNDGDIMLREYK